MTPAREGRRSPSRDSSGGLAGSSQSRADSTQGSPLCKSMILCRSCSQPSQLGWNPEPKLGEKTTERADGEWLLEPRYPPLQQMSAQIRGSACPARMLILHFCSNISCCITLRRFFFFSRATPSAWNCQVCYPQTSALSQMVRGTRLECSTWQRGACHLMGIALMCTCSWVRTAFSCVETLTQEPEDMTAAEMSVFMAADHIRCICCWGKADFSWLQLAAVYAASLFQACGFSMLNATSAASALPSIPLAQCSHSPMMSQNVELIQLWKKSFSSSVPQCNLAPDTLAQHGVGRQDCRSEKKQHCHHSVTPAHSLQAQRTHIGPPPSFPPHPSPLPLAAMYHWLSHNKR